MRGLMGAIVLIAGVGGLAWWGSGHQAVRMQDEIAEAASEKVSTSIHGVTTEVKGRDIVLSGLVDSESERTQLLADLGNVPGRRVVRDDTNMLEKAEPYTFNASKNDGSITIQSGNYPQERQRSAYDGITGADKLVLASGAPQDWTRATSDGINALGELTDGTLAIENQTIHLTGTALTNKERDAALSPFVGLDTFTVEDSIKVLDDGKPAAFEITWDASKGGSLTGKLPRGLSAEDLAGALGTDRLTGDSHAALIGDEAGAEVPAQLETLRPWLPQVETAKYMWTAEMRSLDVALKPGGNARLVQMAMQKDLPDTGVKVTVAEQTATEGDERTNAATGKTEIFVSGFWLPKVDLEPTIETCTKFTDSALAKNKINFLSGSANLDAESVLAINDIAAVVRRCTLDGKLRAELGGHTDDVGNLDDNLTLSRSRASSVRMALVSRGVPATSLYAVGYGQTRPIADNTTEEGRAKNRRTTIRWMAY